MGWCRQFSCLPSQLYAEDTELLRLLAIEARGTPQQDPDDEHGEEVDYGQ